MDGAQHALTTGRLGITTEEYERYLARVPESISMSQWVGSLWYRAPTRERSRIGQFLSHHPSLLRRVEEWGTAARPNLEIYLLTHDWSLDPLFFGDAPAIRRIYDSQVRALEGLRRVTNETELGQLMRTFAIESRLYERTLRSVGVEPVIP